MTAIQIPRVRTIAFESAPAIEATVQRPSGDQPRVIYAGSPRHQSYVPRVIPHQPRPSPSLPSTSFPLSVQKTFYTTDDGPLRFGEAINDELVKDFRKQASITPEQKSVFTFKPRKYDDKLRQEKLKLVEGILPPLVEHVPETARFIYPRGVGDKPCVSVRTKTGELITVDILTSKVCGEDVDCDISPFDYIEQIRKAQLQGFGTNMIKLSTYVDSGRTSVLFDKSNYKDPIRCNRYSLEDYLTNDWKADNISHEEIRLDLANILLQGGIPNKFEILELFDHYHMAQNDDLKTTIAHSLVMLPHLTWASAIFLETVTILSMTTLYRTLPLKQFIDAMMKNRKKAREMTNHSVLKHLNSRDESHAMFSTGEHANNLVFWLNLWIELYERDDFNVKEASINSAQDFEYVAKKMIDLYPKILEDSDFWEIGTIPRTYGDGPKTLNMTTVSILIHALNKVGENLPSVDVYDIHPKVAELFNEYGYTVDTYDKKRMIRRGILEIKPLPTTKKYSRIFRSDDFKLKRQQLTEKNEKQILYLDQIVSSKLTPYFEKLTRGLTVDESIEFDEKISKLGKSLYINEKYIHMFDPFDEKSLYYDPFLEKLHDLDIIPTYNTSKL